MSDDDFVSLFAPEPEPARWIVIPNWGEFQHYRDRDPKWIKTYTRLHSDRDFMQLSSHRRAVLFGIWLEYASSDGRLALDTRSLSRQLEVRVTTKDLESLNHAGFIDVSASKPLALRYQAASPEKRRVREEKVVEGPSSARASGDLPRDEQGLANPWATDPAMEPDEQGAHYLVQPAGYRRSLQYIVRDPEALMLDAEGLRERLERIGRDSRTELDDLMLRRCVKELERRRALLATREGNG